MAACVPEPLQRHQLCADGWLPLVKQLDALVERQITEFTILVLPALLDAELVQEALQRSSDSSRRGS